MPETIYVPRRHRIALCLGVEGVWNDGAYECFAATITAMLDMPQYKRSLSDYGLAEKLHPAEWKKLRESNFRDNPKLGELWTLFREQRPAVKVAEDYLNTIVIAHKRPDAVRRFMADQKNRQAYDEFFQLFDEGIEGVSDSDLAEFGDLFYNQEKGTGRRWLQNQDPFAWQDLNQPMGDALRELRKIVAASRACGGDGGYDIWFVTTKGEGDSFDLCSAYRRLGLLGKDEYSETGGRACIVSRKRIIGRETLDQIKKCILNEMQIKAPTKELNEKFKKNVTAHQLRVVQQEMGIPFPQIMKIDDRVDEEGAQQVFRIGSRQVCTTHGYKFGFQVEELRSMPYINVIDSENMAADVSKLVVETWGFD